MNVCVMVDYPSGSVCKLYIVGDPLSVHPDLLDMIKKGVMEARQVGQLRTLVVHLSVDNFIDGLTLLRAPCRFVVLVIDALEVSGKSTWSGR